MRRAHPLRQPNPLIGRRGWHPNVGDQNRRSMRFDEFDRGVVILGGTDDSYVGVDRQRPGNAVPQEQRILCDDDRNSITHVAVAPPLLILITNHDRLPEAVNVEFSDYLAYRLQVRAFSCGPFCPCQLGILSYRRGFTETVSTNRSGV